MKKIILSAAIAIFCLGIGNAQEIKFGAKAGLNLSSVGGDETDDVESRTGFHVGGVAEIMISDKFAFQPELVYSAQGAKSEFSESGNGFSFTEESELKLTYLNIPLLAKYYVADGFSIEAGPQIGILLSADAEFTETETFGGVTETFSGEDDVKDDISSIDFGVGVGLGYKMESGLNFALRYNLGLSNINDFEGSDDFKQQNNVIQVSVGYFFN